MLQLTGMSLVSVRHQSGDRSHTRNLCRAILMKKMVIQVKGSKLLRNKRDLRVWREVHPFSSLVLVEPDTKSADKGSTVRRVQFQ